jgi:hypothetical protein
MYGPAQFTQQDVEDCRQSLQEAVQKDMEDNQEEEEEKEVKMKTEEEEKEGVDKKMIKDEDCQRSKCSLCKVGREES